MLGRLFNVIAAWFNALIGKAEDPQVMLEQMQDKLQEQLVQVRQAVAQAIATEKQLEQNLLKNRDQANTWQNRAAMAVQQNDDGLAREALQRKQQYAQAAAELEAQLKAQKEATATLRGRLAELETEVQKAYTKKQVLIARDKAATATAKANEMLSKTNSGSAMSVIDKMENKIQEKEARAMALSDLSSDQLEQKFKSFEGQSSIEAELAALKGQAGQGDQSVLLSNPQANEGPILIEVKDKDTVEADVRQVDDNK